MTRRHSVVTGGGTGLGAAIALRLAQEGDDVTIVGRRADVLAAQTESIDAAVGRAAVTAVSADLTSPQEVETLLAATSHRPVDVLVANAGGGSTRRGADLEETSALTRELFEINLLTAVLTVEGLRDRLTRPGGRVVVMGSIAGVRGGGVYGAMKAAVASLALGWAAELGPKGITVNAVAPGFVPATEFWDGRLTPDAVRQRVEPTLLGRAGEPSEVADAVAYLAGEGAAWTTGQILQVNGGACLGRG